jgi:chitodextrinase
MTIVVGIPGIQGPPGLNWRNAWSSTATYAQGDGVSYNGASWIALSASVNVPPGNAPLQWSPLIQVAFPNYATFAALQIPTASLLVFVTADETKGGTPTLYFFDASGNRYWMAMVLDS